MVAAEGAEYRIDTVELWAVCSVLFLLREEGQRGREGQAPWLIGKEGGEGLGGG